MAGKPVYITKPYLPPFEELVPSLEEIWQSKILSNGGAFHQRFEEELCEYLGVKCVSLVTNGTLALITALRAKRIAGEVITSPFSFAATAHAILWSQAKPVFVDIDPSTLNISPDQIEAAITPQTTCILPVHCYGRPCDTDAIKNIAAKHGLKIIYDAAHAFGVEDTYGSVLNQGDLSVLSFHATKVFNTFEGGAVICPDEESKAYVDKIKNFGLTGESEVIDLGINGKMSEFNAALGLLQLKHIDEAIRQRKQIDIQYKAELSDITGIRCCTEGVHGRSNYAYFPVLVGEDYAMSRDELCDFLVERGIHARRYFYPLISEFPLYRNLPSACPDKLKVATKISRQILCLPIYPGLDVTIINEICGLIRGQN